MSEQTDQSNRQQLEILGYLDDANNIIVNAEDVLENASAYSLQRKDLDLTVG